jgi:polar amino acid transport system ATP-binding protein
MSAIARFRRRGHDALAIDLTDTTVTLEGVTRRFGAKTAIDDVTLRIPEGSTTCLIGPSGSGKSTLLRMINLLERPDEGRVLIGREEVSAPGYPIEALRSRIGMVFQQYSLFPHMTVLDNVTFSLREVHHVGRDEAVERARRELDRVGASGLEDRLPDQISGGERQRVAIARSLVISPKIMLFDEVTSALDPELVKGVLSLLAEFTDSGITILVVTHEMRFARESASDIAFMDRGRIVEQGPPDQVFDDPRSDRLKNFVAAIG